MARHDSCYICGTWITVGRRFCRPCLDAERRANASLCACGGVKHPQSARCSTCRSSRRWGIPAEGRTSERLAPALAFASDVANRSPLSPREVARLVKAREGQRRRIANERANPTEPYADRDIFERDGWCCGICTRPVDGTLIWPDPGAATIDHILPVSAGGADAPVNVRLAHYRCNVVRGNRGDVQLRLLG